MNPTSQVDSTNISRQWQFAEAWDPAGNHELFRRSFQLESTPPTTFLREIVMRVGSPISLYLSYTTDNLSQKPVLRTVDGQSKVQLQLAPDNPID
jgi:hypothetical protein